MSIPEEKRAYQKAYYQAHKDKWPSYQKKHNAKHPGLRAARQREHYSEHREEILARNRVYHAAHRDRQLARNKAYNLAKYGLTVEQFDQRLEDQDGVCYICCKPSRGRLHVDHDHRTGQIRGLLCNSCNSMLARAHDNPVVLLKAAAYLEARR